MRLGEGAAQAGLELDETARALSRPSRLDERQGGKPADRDGEAIAARLPLALEQLGSLLLRALAPYELEGMAL